MASMYDDWVSEAPDAWKADGWLQENRPISISTCHGQNQKTCSDDPIQKERQILAWEEELHWEKIHCVRFSLASEIGYVML